MSGMGGKRTLGTSCQSAASPPACEFIISTAAPTALLAVRCSTASARAFGLIPCAAQLVETGDGLVLIDTGYGTADVWQPHLRLSKFFHAVLNIRFRREKTALYQVKGLAFLRPTFATSY